MHKLSKIAIICIGVCVMSFQLLATAYPPVGGGCDRASGWSDGTHKQSIQLSSGFSYAITAVLETSVAGYSSPDDNFDTKIVNTSNGMLDDDAGTKFYSRYEMSIAAYGYGTEVYVKPYYESDPNAWFQYYRMSSYVKDATDAY